jgi:hypothetical protein
LRPGDLNDIIKLLASHLRFQRNHHQRQIQSGKKNRRPTGILGELNQDSRALRERRKLISPSSSLGFDVGKGPKHLPVSSINSRLRAVALDNISPGRPE